MNFESAIDRTRSQIFQTIDALSFSLSPVIFLLEEENGQPFEGRLCSRANSTVERQPANFCSGPIPAASLVALLPL